VAIGDFGDVLDSQTFTQIENQPPNLRRRNDNVALLLTQAPAHGYIHIRSLDIDNAGLIDATPLDTFEILTITHRDMGLLHWLDDVFVVYTNNHVAAGLLHTVGCDEDGEIADSQLDYLQVANASNVVRRSELIKPHDGVLLTGPSCHESTNANNTVLITDGGIMPASVADTMALPNAFNLQSLRQGAGDWIVCLAALPAEYRIHTFTCTDAGVLPAAVHDTWGPIASAQDLSSLCRISSTMFAVFVKDDDNSLQIHTFSIQPDGDINKSWEDSEQVEAAGGGSPHMMEMGEGYFVLAYTTADPNWKIKTYFIATDGTIQDGAIDSKDMTSGNRGNERFEQQNGNIWTFTYEESAGVVRIDTILILTPGVEGPHNELVFGIGP